MSEEKREYDASVAQEKILQAATELFAEQDFASVSTVQIAARAGVAQSQINYHFRTKHRLRLAVFYRIFGEYSRQQRELLQQVDSSTSEESIRLYFGFFRKYPCFHRLLSESLIATSSGQSGFPVGSFPVLVEGAKGFAYGQKEGIFLPGHPPQFFIIAMLSLVTHWFEGRHIYLPESGLHGKCEQYDDRYLDFIVRVFTQGTAALPDDYLRLLDPSEWQE